MRPPGCPIRTPQDLRPPAPPLGISPRGRVLPRPPSPRHPPCARLPDVFYVHCSINLLDPGTPVRSCVPDRLAPAKDASFAHAARWLAAPSRSIPGSRRPCSNRTIVMLLIQCAWMIRHDQVGQPHPRPQDPAGLAWRIVKVQEAGQEIGKNNGNSELVLTYPPRKVGAPGLEPGTSALSGPRSDHLSYAPASSAAAPGLTAQRRSAILCSSMIPHALPVTGRAAYAQDGAREADGCPSCSSAC